MEDYRSHEDTAAAKLAENLDRTRIPPVTAALAVSGRFTVISDNGENGGLVDRWAVWDSLMDWPAYKTLRLPEADMCGLERESAETEARALNAEHEMAAAA